ncbi:MAG: hypothetical protein WC765_06685 [Phycisphaerae bacterium]|jgi:hypothetical protein
MDSDLTLDEIFNYFKNPTLHSPQNLYEYKDSIPNGPGLYAWYFNIDVDFNCNPLERVSRIKTLEQGNPKSWFLLYVGIAGKKKGRTLRDRIYGEHLNQNSKGSTLRQSLAALLWHDIGLDPKKQLNGEDEKRRLNCWIFNHARVTWIETNKPDKLEKLILSEYGNCLPLNLNGNKANQCRKEVEQLRKQWRKKGSWFNFLKS